MLFLNASYDLDIWMKESNRLSVLKDGDFYFKRSPKLQRLEENVSFLMVKNSVLFIQVPLVTRKGAENMYLLNE